MRAVLAEEAQQLDAMTLGHQLEEVMIVTGELSSSSSAPGVKETAKRWTMMAQRLNDRPAPLRARIDLGVAATPTVGSPSASSSSSLPLEVPTR